MFQMYLFNQMKLHFFKNAILNFQYKYSINPIKALNISNEYTYIV